MTCGNHFDAPSYCSPHRPSAAHLLWPCDETAMEEPRISISVPRQIHEDIVLLQGQEIIRIRELLQNSEPRIEALQGENERLKTEHEEVVKELEDLRSRPPPEPAAPPEPPKPPIIDDIVKLVSPRAAFRNAQKLPAYGTFQIPPFYMGRSPAKCLNALKDRVGYLRVVTLRGGEERWLEHYNTCIVVRPDKRRRRDGSWVDTKLLRPHRTVNVVTSIFGRWYYLGTYQCAAVAALKTDVWDELPEKSQRGVLRFMAHNDDRRDAQDGIRRGEVGLHRIELHRVGFDEAVQGVLVAAGKSQADEAGESEGSYGSGREGYE